MLVLAGFVRKLDHGCGLLEDAATPIQSEVVVGGHFGKGNRERHPEFGSCQPAKLCPTQTTCYLGDSPKQVVVRQVGSCRPHCSIQGRVMLDLDGLEILIVGKECYFI